MTPAWILALEANFGSVDAWRAGALALARDQGGVGLWFRPSEGRLVHRAAADTRGDGAVPLLVLEGAAPSLETIDWNGVYERYQAAVHAASEPFGAPRHSVSRGLRLLDVRRAGIYRAAKDVIAGASWRDPARVAQWATELPAGEPVLVHCIYGNEVGRATALRLRAAGINARFLEGGIDGWRTAGLALAARPDAAGAG
jgi:superoxide dismutase, Fe-Mn family